MNYNVGTIISINKYNLGNSTSERDLKNKLSDYETETFIGIITESRYPNYKNDYYTVKLYIPETNKCITVKFIVEKTISINDNDIAYAYSVSDFNDIIKKLQNNDLEIRDIKTVSNKNTNVETKSMIMSKTDILINDMKAASAAGLRIKGGKIVADRIRKIIKDNKSLPAPVRFAMEYEAAQPIIALTLASMLNYIPQSDNEKITILRECLMSYGTADLIDAIPVEEWIDYLFQALPTEVIKDFKKEKPALTPPSNNDD